MYERVLPALRPDVVVLLDSGPNADVVSGGEQMIDVLDSLRMHVDREARREIGLRDRGCYGIDVH